MEVAYWNKRRIIDLYRYIRILPDSSLFRFRIEGGMTGCTTINMLENAFCFCCRSRYSQYILGWERFVPRQRNVYPQARAYPRARAYLQARANPRARAYLQARTHPRARAHPQPSPICPIPWFPDGTNQGKTGTGWMPTIHYRKDGCRQTDGPTTWMKTGQWSGDGGKWTGNGTTSMRTEA